MKKLQSSLIVVLSVTVVVLALILVTTGSTEDSGIDRKALISEVEPAVDTWVDKWNGKIDPDTFLAAYHAEHKYIWRGAYPYTNTKEGVEKFFVGKTNYSISRTEPDYTIISPDCVIAFFHFKDKNSSAYGSGAITLVLTKRNGIWKVAYGHESEVKEE